MLIFIVFVMGVAIAAVVMLQKVDEVDIQQLSLEGTRVADAAAAALDTVLIQGDGFSSELILPAYLADRQYNVTAYPRLVVVRMEGQDFQRATLVQNLSGSLRQGTNTLTNRQGVIVIT
ncbi:MAG: hypothetical protein HY520_01275 [Candidatus Aenigmarchaeota archaeon]|nr:hypothetical protein [Candidatus Aenigmarchaeota archaeon]